MAKKANGEGSIQKYYQNGNYKGWRGTLSIGYDDKGRIKRKQFYGKTKTEVLEKMTKYQYENNIGLIPADDEITLSKWFHTWLFEFRYNDLKPSSFERYESLYRNYIRDSPIGDIKLIDLRTTHLQSYYNDMLQEDKSISIVKTINKVIHTCLESALQQNYIYKNYSKAVILPKESKEESFTVFTVEEQQKFLKAIQGHKYQMGFTLAIGTGLRLGELLGLKWSDIDVVNKTLHVSRTIKAVMLHDKKGNSKRTLLEQSPKTKSSTRTVPIPANIFKGLDKHKKEQRELKMKNRDVYNDQGYIFCDKIGNPLDPRKLPRSFKTVLKKAKIREIKFHSLRHTYATRLFEADVPIKTVQKLMGHTDITTTMNIYTHVMPEQKAKAVEKINELFMI